MKTFFRSILIVFASVIILTGCGNNGCEEIRESFCLADLSSLSGATINKMVVLGIGQGGGAKDTTGIAQDQEMISVNNPKNLEFILNPNSTITDIRLMMNITLDGDQFQYEDTIHFVYEPHPYFLDMECGCSMYFSLEDVSSTNNFLRSITIKNKEITNEESLNIIIEY